MAFQNAPIAIGQIEFADSVSAKHELGAHALGIGGRKYVYVKAGASALVAGNVIQAPAQLANHNECAPAAAAIGATSVTVTLGNTALTADFYQGGQLVVGTTPGEGYAYQIEGHAAADASAAVVIRLVDPIQVALTTNSRVTLVANPYRGVIQAPATTLTNAPIGVAVYPITAAYYGWIQVAGPAPVLISGTPAVGTLVTSPGGSVAGAVIAGAADTTRVVGAMMVTGQDGKIMPVFLCLG